MRTLLLLSGLFVFIAASKYQDDHTASKGKLLSQPGPTFQVTTPATFSVIAFGDQRFTDPANVTATNPVVRKWLVNKIASEKPVAVFLNGDVPLNGDVQNDYSVYRDETEPWRIAYLHVYPALGNHEFHGPDPQASLENWWNAFPELRNRRWYSVQLGPRLYAINLDSDASLLPESAKDAAARHQSGKELAIPSGGALDTGSVLRVFPENDQAHWLAKQMADLPSQVDFVLISLHHPPVADVQTRYEVNHNSRPNEIALRDFLSSIQDKMHARILVSAGHIHNYERHQLNNITYLVSGGGGARPYNVDRSPDDLYKSELFPNYHYVKFELLPDRLKVTMYRIVDPTAPQLSVEAKDRFEILVKPR